MKLDYIPAVMLLAQAYLLARGKLDDLDIPGEARRRITEETDAVAETERAEWWINILGSEMAFRNGTLNEIRLLLRAPRFEEPNEVRNFALSVYQGDGSVAPNVVSRLFKYLDPIVRP